jgi:hypothetical protein
MHSESVRPCQHDRCPCRLVCQIYGTDMLLLLRGHILSIQTIDSIPTYCARSTLANSPPHTETQRDPSRPPGQRGLQTSHHGAQQIHSIAPAHCCSSRPRQRLTDCPSPVEPLPPFPPSTAARPVCTRPCISQTSSPSSKHSRPAGLLAVRARSRIRPQATGCPLETSTILGVVFLTSRNLGRVPNSQTAARFDPLRHTNHAVNHLCRCPLAPPRSRPAPPSALDPRKFSIAN